MAFAGDLEQRIPTDQLQFRAHRLPAVYRPCDELPVSDLVQVLRRQGAEMGVGTALLPRRQHDNVVRFPAARRWTSSTPFARPISTTNTATAKAKGEGGTDPRGGFPPQQTLQVIFRKQCHMVLPKQSTMSRGAIASDCHELPTRPTTDERTTAATSVTGVRVAGRVTPLKASPSHRTNAAEAADAPRTPPSVATSIASPTIRPKILALPKPRHAGCRSPGCAPDPHRHAVGRPQDARDHGDCDHEFEEFVERGELPDQVAPEGVLGLGLRLRRVVLEPPIDRRREGLGLGVASGLDEDHGDLALLVECILPYLWWASRKDLSRPLGERKTPHTFTEKEFSLSVTRSPTFQPYKRSFSPMIAPSARSLKPA